VRRPDRAARFRLAQPPAPAQPRITTADSDDRSGGWTRLPGGAPAGVYLVAPDATARTLQAISAWLQALSHILTAILLTVAGVVLIGNGIYGLA